MSLSIFVSYSHEDADLVGPVVRLLRATDDFVFLDTDSIKPGRRWREEIGTALAAAQLVLVFWCLHSSRSDEVRQEYQRAIAAARDVLPVLLDHTPVPDDLGRFQWIDFRHLARDRHGDGRVSAAPAAHPRRLAVGLAAASVLLVLGGSLALWRAAPPRNALTMVPTANVSAAHGGAVDFSVTLPAGISADAIEWTVDGEVVAGARGRRTWQFSPDPTANATTYEVGVRVADPAAPCSQTWEVRVKAAPGEPPRLEVATPATTATPIRMATPPARLMPHASRFGVLVAAALAGLAGYLGLLLRRRRRRDASARMAATLASELRRRAQPSGLRGD